MPYKLDLGKLFSDTFELYKRNLGTMCLVVLILMIIPMIFGPAGSVMTFITQMTVRQGGDDTLFAMLIAGQVCLQILQTILQWYIVLGILRQCLYIARGQTDLRMNLLSSPFSLYLKYVGFALAFGGIQFCVMLPTIIPISIGAAMGTFSQSFDDPVVIGLFVAGGCLALPCYCFLIWLTTRLCLAVFFIVDQNESIANAIIYSWRVSSGNFWLIFIAQFVLGICAVLGMFLCCVGIILTGAIAVFGQALIYLQLTGQPNGLDFGYNDKALEGYIPAEE